MKICWFGIYKPDFSRNRIYIKGLKKLGVQIMECRDDSAGFLKYLKLFWKHWQLKDDYDFLVVGYPGHPTVWLAKLISNRPVIFDALCTMEEGVVISRSQAGFLGLYATYIRFIDWLAVRCADIILVETEAQRDFFIKKFKGTHNKTKVLYIGADNDVFYPDQSIKNKSEFTVVFRGQFLPEAGVNHIIEAAKILENNKINFLLIGQGFLKEQIVHLINILRLSNLEMILSEGVALDDFRKIMSTCHLSLGQLENHERLARTVPHKCYESMAMKLPYVTARTRPVAEILKEGESVVFVNPADPQDLADKILYLKNNPEIAQKIGDNGYKVYLEKFTPEKLAQDILAILKTLNPRK